MVPNISVVDQRWDRYVKEVRSGSKSTKVHEDVSKRFKDVQSDMGNMAMVLGGWDDSG